MILCKGCGKPLEDGEPRCRIDGDPYHLGCTQGGKGGKIPENEVEFFIRETAERSVSQAAAYPSNAVEWQCPRCGQRTRLNGMIGNDEMFVCPPCWMRERAGAPGVPGHEGLSDPPGPTAEGHVVIDKPVVFRTAPEAPDVTLPNGIRLSDVKASEEYFKTHKGIELSEAMDEDRAVREAVGLIGSLSGVELTFARLGARHAYRARQPEIDRLKALVRALVRCPTCEGTGEMTVPDGTGEDGQGGTVKCECAQCEGRRWWAEEIPEELRPLLVEIVEG